LTAGAWTLTTRVGSQVDHERLESLDDAVGALERRIAELASGSTREELRFFNRRIEPVRQVVARLEIAGPRSRGHAARGGVDVRGDGSAEAFSGRLRREVIERRSGESAPAALRRALST
jgi:hypothetical protein